MMSMFRHIISLLDRIIGGVRLIANDVDICAKVKGATVRFTIDNAKMTPYNDILKEQHSLGSKSLTQQNTFTSGGGLFFSPNYEDGAESSFMWSLNVTLLTGHYQFDADGGRGKKVRFCTVTGVDCTISTPEILSTLVSGTSPAGKYLNIAINRTNLLSVGFHPVHVKKLSIPLLEFCLGSSAFSSWIQNLEKESDYSCRQYTPTTEELQSYESHWKSQIRSGTFKPHPVDRKISVCHMIILRALAANWKRRPCPPVVDSRALSGGIVEVLDLNGGFMYYNNSDLPVVLGDPSRRLSEETMDVLLYGAHHYLSDPSKIEALNGLLYWLCNEWVFYFEGRGPPIAEISASISIDKFEFLVLKGGSDSTDSLSNNTAGNGDNLQARFIFSCYKVQLDVNALLARVPSIPQAKARPKEKSEKAMPYLSNEPPLAIGAYGQMESDYQHAYSMELSVCGASLIDVEQLKENRMYCSLFSTKKDKAVYFSLHGFTLDGFRITLHEAESQMYLMLQLERLWTLCEAIIAGTTSIVSFFSGRDELATCSPDEDIDPTEWAPTNSSDNFEKSEQSILNLRIPKLGIDPSAGSQVCIFMPQLQANVNVELNSVNIVLIEDNTSVNTAMILLHSSLRVNIISGGLKEKLNIDARELSLVPVVRPGVNVVSDVMSTHVNLLRSAIEYIEQGIESDIGASPLLPETEESEKMRNVIVGGMDYAELGYKVIEKEPLLHPTAVYLQFESSLLNENLVEGSHAITSSDGDEDEGAIDESLNNDISTTPFVYVTLSVEAVELLEMSDREALAADEFVVDAFNGRQVLTAKISDEVLHTGEGKVIPGPNKFGALYQEYLLFCLPRSDAMQDINISISPPAESMKLASGTLRATPRVTTNDVSELAPVRVVLEDKLGKRCGHAVMHAHIDPAYLLVSILKMGPAYSSVVVIQVHVEHCVGTVKINPNKLRRKNRKNKGVAEGLLFDIQTTNPRVYILAFILGQEEKRATCDIPFDRSHRGLHVISLAGVKFYFSLDLVRYSLPKKNDLLYGLEDDLSALPVLVPEISSDPSYDPKGSLQPPYPGGSYPGIPQKYMDYLKIEVVKEKDEYMGIPLICSFNINVKPGIFFRITDLDGVVLQRTFTSVQEDVTVIQERFSKTVGVEAAQENDEALQEVIQLLRQAFRRADLDNSGTLNESEVKILLQRHLTTLSEHDLDTQVQRFMTVAGDKGAISLDSFTTSMQKVLSDCEDPVNLDRARKRALVEAFNEADIEGSGELDRNDIMVLLRSLTPSAITSEIELAVDNFVRLADLDGTGLIDLDEFVYLCDALSKGVEEGRTTMLASDFCCSSFRENLLDEAVQPGERRVGNKLMTLGKFLAPKGPNYKPDMVWAVIDRELGVGSLPKGSTSHDDPRFSDEFLDESQRKLVKAFKNYMLAREVWGLVIVPELCADFLPRVSSIEAVDSKVACVQMLTPLTMGNELYNSFSPGHMRLVSLPSSFKKTIVTGIRTSLRDRRSRNSRYLTFKVSSPCDIHVCLFKPTRGTVVLPSWLRRSGYRQRKLVLEAEYEFPRRQESKKRVQFVLFSRAQKSAGTVVLGGNEGIQYHYVVLISPAQLDGDIYQKSMPSSKRISSSSLSIGVHGKCPLDSHTLRWRLRPSSELCNSDAWYRSINAKARERTVSINELISRVGEAVLRGENAALSQRNDLPSFTNLQISVTVVMGPIKLQLINVSRAQSLGSRLNAPLLEVSFNTLPDSAPVIQICNVEGCTRMVDGNATTYIGVVPCANDGNLFCDRHLIRCSIKTCERMATYCLANGTEPILCRDHASHKMVPYLSLGTTPSKENAELRGPEVRLFWWHPVGSNVLDRKDKITMRAVFGLKVRYFNTFTRQIEHLIEPWGAVLKVGSVTDDSFASVVLAAPMHFGVNITTSFLSSLQQISSMFSSSNPFLKASQSTAYGDLGLYSKWAYRELDPSRHMKVRNRLGVPIVVSMASILGGDGTRITTVVSKSKGPIWKRKKETVQSNVKKHRKKNLSVKLGGISGAPTIPNGEDGKLFIPNLDAVKHLRVQLTPEGYSSVVGIEFDFFSQKEQLFHLIRTNNPIAGEADLSSHNTEHSEGSSSSEFDSDDDDVDAFITQSKKFPLVSKRKGPVAVVVKFIQEQTTDPDTLDIVMEVSTNISIHNDTFSPILVNLIPDSAGGLDDSCLERGKSIPLSVQILAHELLYITEEEPGVRDEPLELTPYMFDVNGTPFSRHSSEVLKHCMTIHMTDPSADELEQADKIQKSIKSYKFSGRPVLWQLTVEPPYVIVNALPLSIKIEISQEKEFAVEPDVQIFCLERGGKVDVPMLDLECALQVRVQLGGGGKLSEPFIIEANQHLCRSELVKVPVRAVDPEGGPQISVSVKWESMTMPRTITVFSEVWVLNRTGVAMCYRTPNSGSTLSKQLFDSTPLLKSILPHHVGDNAVPSHLRLRDEAYYTTDVRSAVMCKDVDEPEENEGFIPQYMGEINEDQSSTMDALLPPILLHCPTKCVQIMPQYMAQDANDKDSFCIYDMSCSSEAEPHCVSLSPRECMKGSPIQIYWDVLDLRIRFPVEVHSHSRTVIHVLLGYYDRPNLSSESHSRGTYLSDPSNPTYLSFVCDISCYIYIALDAQDGGGPPVPPLWVRRIGFAIINEREGPVKATGCFAALRNGVYFYRRYFVAGSRVLLGRVEALAAVPYEGDTHNYQAIADISMVEMNSLTESITSNPMGRHWFVVPEWSTSISVYFDGKCCYVDTPPTLFSGRPLPPLTLIQTKQEIASFSVSVTKNRADALASFVVLQDSTVYLCYDSRGEFVPYWVTIGNWSKMADFVFNVRECEAKDAAFSYNVFTRDFSSGSVVQLGRRWAKGKPYFLFIRVKVDEPTSAMIEADFGSFDVLPQLGADAFWNTEANGPLVQIPLQLDWRGRSWSRPVSTRTLRDVGTIRTKCGVFGFMVNVLPGQFHVTRVLNLYPPVVVKNELKCPILVVPCFEAHLGDADKKKFNKFRHKFKKYRKNKRIKHEEKKLVALREKIKGRNGRQYIIPQNIYTDTEGNPVFISSQSYVTYVSPGESAVVYDFVNNTDPDSIFLGEEAHHQKQRRRCFRIISTWPSWENDTLSNISHQYMNPNLSMADGVSTLGSDMCKFEQGSELNDDQASHTTTCSKLDGSKLDDSEPEVSLPIFYENIGETSHLWLKQGHYDNLLVKAMSQLQPNQTTVLVRLSDVSKHPPMRIENLSSYRTLVYRIGDSQNIHTLGPMRWRAFVWGDSSHSLHVGIDENDSGQWKNKAPVPRFFGKLSSHARRLSSQSRRRSYSPSITGPTIERNLINPLERQTAGLELGPEEIEKEPPANDDNLNLKPYTLQGVSVEPKLHSHIGERPMLVECIRRREMLATLALTFRDAPEKARLHELQLNVFQNDDETDNSDDDDVDVDTSLQYEDMSSQSNTLLEVFVRAVYFSSFRVNIAGCFITLVHSMPTGHKELISITADDLLAEKVEFSDHLRISLWHLQIDDLQPTAINSIIMQPSDSGFNSHLEPTMIARPFCMIESHRDLELLITHHIQSFSLLRLCIKPLESFIYIDGFVDIALLFMDALSWAIPDEDGLRELNSKQVTELLTEKLTLLPVAPENIYLSTFQAELPLIHVRFHLGRKVTGLIGTKLLSGEKEDDFQDDEGFLSSPLMDGAIVEVLKSLGDTFANASPTFSFPTIDISNYFGTASDFVSKILLILMTQTVKQTYSIVGSIDLLGDPLTLCRRYVGGVSGFVEMTSRGRPAQGAKELVKGFIGGTACSVSKMAGAVDSFLSGLQTTDAESELVIRVLHLYDRKAEGEARRHFGHGVKSGAKHFARSMVRGVTGIVTQPVNGVQTRGAGGLFLGVGKGITGLVVAPVSGALGVAKYLVGGIDDTTRLLDAPRMGRRRPARDGKHDLVLHPIEIDNLDASIPHAYHVLYDDEGNLVDERHMMSRIDADQVNKITDVTSIDLTEATNDGEDITNVEFGGKSKTKNLRFRKHIKRAVGFPTRRRGSESRKKKKKKKKET